MSRAEDLKGFLRRRGNAKDYRGLRFGRLVVTKFIGTAEGHSIWKCRCDCGKEKVVSSDCFSRNRGSRSCGCLSREASDRKRGRQTWNKGKTYAIESGERIYKTRHSWAKAAIRHYGNRCEKCGWQEGRCDAHHRVPKSKGGAHTISNAVVLCPNHHRLEHENGGAD